MDDHQKSLRVGAAAILCALMLRLFAGGMPEGVTSWLLRPGVQSFLIYLETGRVVRFLPSTGEEFAGESPAPLLTESAGTLLGFTAEQAEHISIKNSSGLSVDPAALLTQPLNWALRGEQPTVLILHTHTTESYTKSPGESYTESGDFRTLDERYNMLSVGDALTALLEAEGISVIHDRAVYDYPSYDGSYALAREATLGWLEAYPSIVLVLDLHRDASGDIHNQLRTAIQVEGAECARLMLVMGTDGAGMTHPEWRENLALGLKLQTVLESTAPGITRPISLRAQRFNQDLSTGAMIVEVGAAGDTHAAAVNAMSILAQAIASLSGGSE